jgi:hypothetical protein
MGASLHLSPTIRRTTVMSYFGTSRDAGKSIVFKDTSRLMPPASGKKTVLKDNSRLMPPTFDPFSDEAYAASDEAEDMILARRKNNQEEPRMYVPPTGAEAKLVARQQKEFDESIARDKDEMAAGSESEQVSRGANMPKRMRAASESEQVSRGANMPKRMRAASESEQVSRGANMPKRMRAASESDDADDDYDYVLLDQDAPLANESLDLDDEYPEPVEDIQGDSDLLTGSTIQGNLVDAVEQRLAEELRINDSPRESTTDEESLSSVEAEPTPVTDEAMAKLRETLTADFKKIMGSSYDPNSSVDRNKMKVLADFKRKNPNLSTNALALKIYRSGVL